MAARGLAQLVPAAIALALLARSLEPAASAQTASPRTVLAVYWSSEDFPSTPALDAAIQQALRAGSDRIDFYAEYLESDRIQEEQASVSLRDYIRQKFRGRKIDAVIAVTDVALQFALRYREDLFPDAPIVFSGLAAPDASVRASGHGVTGVLTGAGFSDTLQLALRIHPSATRVFYVAGAPDPALRESMRAQLHTVAKGVQLTAVDEASIERLVAAVKAVPQGSVILYIRYSQDDAGSVRFPDEIAAMVAQAATVPVYGVAESYLGVGAVGGLMYSRQLIGTRIGEMVLETLSGRRAQDIPIERAALVPMFDWRQLRRWGIAESSLPAGSIVRFREISIWDEYGGTIVATAGVLLLQTLLISGLVLEHRRRRRAETEARHNMAAMAHLDRRAAMGELATSLAHELNQPLNAILQNAGVVQMLLASHPVPPVLAEIPDIISDIREDDIRASEVIRRMRRLLQKRELESRPVNLNEVAQDTVAIVRPDARSRGVELGIELTDGVRPIMGDRVHLQQVTLNLLMNALDAVAAMPPERRQVRVSTSHSKGEVRLAVADNGEGIPADRISEIFEPFYTTKKEGSGMGMGLAIARGIVEAHAGRMAAENNADGGATVWFSVPVSQGSPEPLHDPPSGRI
jgi:signal transduction histidine kinase